MARVDEISRREHEQVSIFQDRESGLLAIIAVHDTTLGPGLGGARMQLYGSLDEAIYDALLLSQGMTYKNSLAGLDLGGGKSVIVGESSMQAGRKELFRAFGSAVASLGGKYITAEDMGTTVSDIEVVREVCPHVTGRDPAQGGAGDPSPYTAKGVFAGMRACLERRFDSADFANRHVAVQGVGHVGYYLVELLANAGAKVTVADIVPERVAAVVKKFKVNSVNFSDIASVECDIFAPCAMSEALNQTTIKQLRCRIVAGAANAQLATIEIEPQLKKRGIMYAPDFAINSGGVIMCADELKPDGVKPERILAQVEKIYDTIGRILDRSQSTEKLAGNVAIELAKNRIEQARTK